MTSQHSHKRQESLATLQLLDRVFCVFCPICCPVHMSISLLPAPFAGLPLAGAIEGPAAMLAQENIIEKRQARAKENAKNSCTIGAWRSHPQRHQSRISVYISTSLILAWRITGNHGRIESKPARKHMTAKAWLIHCLSFQASFLIYAAVLILFLPGPLAGGLSLGGATSTSAPANRKKQRMLAHE